MLHKPASEFQHERLNFATNLRSLERNFFYKFFVSDVSEDHIVNDFWHFICIWWNGLTGNVKFYYDGRQQNSIAVSGPMTQLSPGGKFSIGVTKDPNSENYFNSFVGHLSCVNIWSFVQSTPSIISMSSGAVNVNGDLLAWRDVQVYIIGNLSVLSSTNVYFPGEL